MQHCGAKLGTFQFKSTLVVLFCGKSEYRFCFIFLAFSCCGELEDCFEWTVPLKVYTCVLCSELFKNHQSRPDIYGFHLIDSLEGFWIMSPYICGVFSHSFLFFCTSSELPDFNHNPVSAGWRPHYQRYCLLLLLLPQVWKNQVRQYPQESFSVMPRSARKAEDAENTMGCFFFSADLGWHRHLQRPGRICSYYRRQKATVNEVFHVLC